MVDLPLREAPQKATTPPGVGTALAWSTSRPRAWSTSGKAACQ